MILRVNPDESGPYRHCLACRRPITMRSYVETPNGDRTRELYVCLGHPPTTFRRVLADLERLEAAGWIFREQWSTVRHPACGAVLTMAQAADHTPAACAEHRRERNIMQADA